MTSVLTSNLVSIISNEYGKLLTSINNNIIQNQTIIVKHENDGIACNKCLDVFIDTSNKNPDMLKLKNKLIGSDMYGSCNTSKDCNNGDFCTGADNTPKNKCIKLNKSAICYDSCIQFLDNINITNTMNFDVKNFINPSTEDLLNVSKKISENIESKYNGIKVDINDINTIVTALSTINLSQQFATSQMAVQIQIENIKGPGTFTNINMSIVSNIIMKAVLTNETIVNSLTNIVNNMIKEITSNVDKNVLSTFDYVWQRIKLYVIIGSIIILFLFIGIVTLLVLRSLRRVKEV